MTLHYFTEFSTNTQISLSSYFENRCGSTAYITSSLSDDLTYKKCSEKLKFFNYFHRSLLENKLTSDVLKISPLK